MILRMRATKAAIVSALALSATAPWASAEARPNPYGPIVERNAFGLKPPPPPQVETPAEPAKPPPNVKLTGISNLFRPRALLEITEQQPAAKPGQAPTPGGTVNRPILSESEAAFGVEVLAIDLERNIVRIRNAGTESELTFEVPKSGGGGPTPPVPGQPPVVNPQALNASSAAGSQPTIISSSSAQATGGGGVSIYGGGNTAAPNNSGGVTSYGGSVPSPLGADTGLRTIPSRTIRTPTATDQQAVDPAQQQLLMELNRTRQQMQQQGTLNNTRPGTSRRPTVEPPLPPTQFSQPNGNPDVQ